MNIIGGGAEARPISNKHWVNCENIENPPWDPLPDAVPLARLLDLSAGNAPYHALERTPGSRAATYEAKQAEINYNSAKQTSEPPKLSSDVSACISGHG